MKTRLLKFLLVGWLVFFTAIAYAQETGDNATYYYNNFETATAGTLSSLGSSSLGNANRAGTSTTLDASTTSPLEGSTSLATNTTNAIGAVRWNFVGNGSGNINLSSNDWEWNFLYRNNTTTGPADPDQMTSASNSWRYWLIANSYTANNMQGFYISHVGTNLVLRYRYDNASGSGRYNSILSTTMANDQQTYIIKVQRLKGGSWAIYKDVYVAGMTTAKTLATISLGTTGNGYSTYYYSYLETTTSSATNRRFQFDKLDMYTRVLQFTAVGANDATNNITQPAYTENQNVNMYGLKIMSRGNFIVNQFALTTTGASFEGYFNGTGSLYRSDDSYFSTATDALVSSVQLTGNAIQDFSFTDYISSSGNTDGSYSVPGYYFINATVKSQLNYGGTPSGTITVTGLSTFTGNSNSSAITYTGPSSNGNVITFATTIDWTGASDNNWNNTGNWSSGVVPTSTAIARIGVVSFKNQPIVQSTVPAIASLIFGPLKSTLTGTPAITLTINTTYTLTVNGSITQYHNSSNGGVTTTITGAGTGTLTCSSFTVGDATTPPAPSGDVTFGGGTSPTNNSTTLNCSVPVLTINGDLNLNSTSSALGTYTFLFIFSGTGYCTNNPIFNLNTGVITANNITTTNSNYNTNNSAVYNGDTGTGNTTLNLLGTTPITVATGGQVDFTNGGSGTGIVNYAATSGTQTVYTTNDAAIGATPNYDNLTLSAASAKTVDGGLLTINANWNTSGGAVSLVANDPTITVGGSWTNAATVTQDAGPITVTADVTNNSGGTLALGSADLSIAGNYTNNLGGVYTQSTGTTYFNGLTTAQALSDVSTTGTTFNKVTFQGSSLTTAIKTMSGSGGFAVSSTGTLTMANATTKLNANGALTLKSDASSTATVAQIPTNAVITGNVNVQRYITGGSGYRGYRLVSSPVNVTSNITGGGNLGLGYLSVSQSFGGTTYRGALTGGPGTGFFVTSGNPSIYLYDETKTTNNTSFVAGKNVGIQSITGTTVSTISGSPAVTTPLVSIPVGNSYLFFFIGDNSSTAVSSAARPSPENTTVTAVGYLNQGNVPVKFWKLGTTTIPYTVGGNGGVLPGYNQIGNPYASTIDLNTFSTDNPTVSNIFWEMTEPGQKYISYKTDGTTSDPKAGRYIVSGQGFIIQGLNTGAKTVTFKESEKVAYPTISKSTTPALLMSTKGDIALFNKSLASSLPEENSLVGLHLQINKDTLVNAACGIYFSKNYDDNFYNIEDALDIDGGNVYMSSYSLDGVRTGINQLADYKEKGKRVKLFVKAPTSGLYKLNLLDIKNMDTVKYKVYLVDHFKKDSLDIGKYKSYNFNIVTTDTTTFGANRFELSIQQVPGPKYQLATFTAQKATDGVLVTWRTYNEGNNYFFTLEKQGISSTDYAPVYQTQSNGGTIYKYTDKTPNTGNNVYRLKQVDLFGNITYSGPVNIYYDKSGNASMFSLYPNPTAETLNVNVTNGKTTTAASSYKLNIYDATGTLVMQKTSDNNSWSENVSQFKPGVYIVELKNNSGNSLGKAKFLKK